MLGGATGEGPERNTIMSKTAKAKYCFPATLYAAIEQDDDEAYFTASASAPDLAWSEDERPIGVYTLKKRAKIVNKSEVQ